MTHVADIQSNHVVAHWSGVTSITDSIKVGVAFEPLTDVWAEARRATGSDSSVACHFDGVLTEIP